MSIENEALLPEIIEVHNQKIVSILNKSSQERITCLVKNIGERVANIKILKREKYLPVGPDPNKNWI